MNIQLETAGERSLLPLLAGHPKDN